VYDAPKTKMESTISSTPNFLEALNAVDSIFDNKPQNPYYFPS